MIKVAILWLVNDKHELLLARRSDDRDYDPGLWAVSVAGRVEGDETFEETVVRETEEELGLKPGTYDPKFLFETEFDHPDGETRKFGIYITNVPSNITEQIQIDTNEVAEIKWSSIDEIKQLLSNSKPGETFVASAFVLWNRVFDAIEKGSQGELRHT
jgi:8-oxo-dGTP pyrophosphatase MutT (NUDIX family)